MLNKKFKFYADGGHGWVAVKRTFLQELGILDKVSNFSYEKGKTVYLEEDADALLFHEAFTKRYGAKPRYDEKHTNNNSPVRGYDRFKPARSCCTVCSGPVIKTACIDCYQDVDDM